MFDTGVATAVGTWTGVGRSGFGGGDADRERVHRTLKRIAKARGALDARELQALREAQALRLWRSYGCSSLVDYLERELGYTPRAAVERIRVATSLGELPGVSAALERGDLSFSAARELTRVATPETEQEWIDDAMGKTARQVEEMVSGHKRGDRPSDPTGPGERTKIVRFEVRATTAALIDHARKALAHERGESIDDDALLQAFAQRLLATSAESLALSDSIGDATESATGSPTGSAPGSATEDSHGESAPNPSTHRIPPFQTAHIVCTECKRGWQNMGGKSVELTQAELDMARCDSIDIGSVDAATPKRAVSSIAPALARLVFARDGHRCAVPGCRSTANLHIHHIIWVSNGGQHVISNLITLCEGHHRAHHDGSLLITGEAPNVTFTRVAITRFTAVTRAAETAAALKRLGFKPAEVKAAVEATKTHVGTSEVSLESWIRYALSKCPRPTS